MHFLGYMGLVARTSATWQLAGKVAAPWADVAGGLSAAVRDRVIDRVQGAGRYLGVLKAETIPGLRNAS